MQVNKEGCFNCGLSRSVQVLIRLFEYIISDARTPIRDPNDPPSRQPWICAIFIKTTAFAVGYKL